LRPLGLIWAITVVFALLGVPVAYLLDSEGIMFALVSRVEERYVFEAYAWTCIAFVIVVAVVISLGVHKNENTFLSKPMPIKSQQYYNTAWLSILSLSLVATSFLFVSSGFTIPLLDLVSNPEIYLLQRTEARANINQNLLNINLLFLCPLSVCIAAFFLTKRRRLKLAISISNILLVAGFSLAKSPVAMAFFIIVIFYSCMKPVNIMKLARYGVLLIAVMIPLFMAADSGRGTWGANRNVMEIVGGRIFYGQWAGLPYFFNIYEKKRAPLGTLLPTYLQVGKGGRWSYKGEESPARQAIRGVTGYKDLEASGVGVAVTFFIGEAYAVWGYSGIIAASLIVGLQTYLLTLIFSSWPRTVWSMFLYSWFVYKIGIGITTGFSAFLFSSSAYLLVILLIITLLTYAHRNSLLLAPALEKPKEVIDAEG